MFKNLFNSERPLAPIKPIEQEQVKTINNNKTTQQIIEEIHETFYSESERLLNDAKDVLSKSQPNYVEQGKRLSALGFNKSKQSNLADPVVSQLNNSTYIQGAINYFSLKYPHYRLITESSIKKICNKYGLIYGEHSDFMGYIPEKNIEEIESFKVDDCDLIWIKSDGSYRSEGYPTIFDPIFLKHLGSDNRNKKGDYFYKDTSFMIAAPIMDFDTKNMKVENFKLVSNLPDPVVFKRVVYGKELYYTERLYLIVTAWGIEESDPLVLNQNKN